MKQDDYLLVLYKREGIGFRRIGEQRTDQSAAVDFHKMVHACDVVKNASALVTDVKNLTTYDTSEQFGMVQDEYGGWIKLADLLVLLDSYRPGGEWIGE